MESVTPVKLLALLFSLLLLQPAAISAQEDSADPTPAEDQEQPIEDEAPAEEPAPAEKPGSRLRPVTEAEEEIYKRQAVREDPFLNAPLGPDPRNLAYYRPIDFLRTEIAYDSSRYIVQDANSAMRGFLTVEIAPYVTATDSLVRLSMDYAAPRKRVELFFEPQHLRPRSVTIFAPAELAASPPLDPKAAKAAAKAQAKLKKQAKSKDVAPPVATESASTDAEPPTAERRTRVEYLFDRVTIERDAGMVATQERMRQLPYSFDIEQLPLLVRQLDFAKLERQWPFEALITDPEGKRSLPLSIEQPKRVEIMSAEPQSLQVYELKMRLGDDENWTWWVERAAPYRLVKFTDGQHTYTLNFYETGPGEY